MAAAVAVAALLTGCSSPAAGLAGGPAATAAPAAGASLGAADFAAAARRPGTVLLDVRTPEEFAAGHLPGATNLNVEAADFAQRLQAMDSSRPYAVYCRSGNRSRVAMTTMQQLGFTSLYDLAGGITAWTSAGGEVVPG